MSNIPFEREDDNIVVDQTYRTIRATVAYARPDGEAMIQLEAGQVLLARPAVDPDWLAWIEDGDVIGYLRIADVERQ